VFAAISYLIVRYLDCHRHASPVELSHPRASSGRSSRIGIGRDGDALRVRTPDW
jgi:hypothetical protein